MLCSPYPFGKSAPGTRHNSIVIFGKKVQRLYGTLTLSKSLLQNPLLINFLFGPF